jgi:hypothetical protein
MRMADAKATVRQPSQWGPALRHIYIGAVHVGLFAFSLWVAYGLRYEFRIPPMAVPIPDNLPILPGEVGVPASAWATFYELLVFVLLVKAMVFGYFRLYAGWWQYVSIQDLVETFKASHISTAIILGAVYMCRVLYVYKAVSLRLAVPDTVLIIDWAATIALVGGLRFLVRIIREGSRPVSPAGLRRVLIIGAGDAGEGILRELYRLPVEQYHVVGFVDDDPKKRGSRIHGVPVLGGVADLAAVAGKQNAEQVIIALPQPTREELRRIIDVCKGRKMIFRIVPGVADLIEGRLDDLPHGVPGAVAEVERQAPARLDGLHGQDVGLGQVIDVNVIADARAVGRGVVRAEDRDGLAPPQGRLQDDRHQVRLGPVVLADAGVGGGPGGVEVPQGRVSQAVGPGVVPQGVLEVQLRLPVGVDGVGRMVLRNRGREGAAVGGGRGGEDDPADAGLAHGRRQMQARHNVVVVVLLGILHALANGATGGKVHDAIPAAGQPRGQAGRVHEVSAEEHLGRHGRRMALGEVVVNANGVPRLQQEAHHVAADVAGPAGDEDFHE